MKSYVTLSLLACLVPLALEAQACPEIRNAAYTSLGPKVIQPEGDTATLVTGLATKRYITRFPTMSEQRELLVEKLDGRSETEVILCAYNPVDGAPVIAQRFTFPNGRDLTRHLFPIGTALTGRMLAVVLDNKSVANTFRYKITSTWQPVRTTFGPITNAYADTHVHMMAHLGFGGKLIYGSPEGPATDQCPPGAHAAEMETFGGGIFGDTAKRTRQLERGLFMHGRRGDPDAWPNFRDVVHQKVHTNTLRDAHRRGMRLMVMSAVSNSAACKIFFLNNPVPRGSGAAATCDDMVNVIRQLDEMRDYASRNTAWMGIAETPWHARQLISQNKLAVVLHVETSGLFPKTDVNVPLFRGPVEDQLQDLFLKGVRSLQIVHEYNNRFAEAAEHHEIGALERETFANENTRGLTTDGRQLIAEMVKRRMILDVAHLAPEALESVFDAVTTRHASYPLMNSHVKFEEIVPFDRPATAPLDRRHHDTMGTFAITARGAEVIRRTGGIVGLRLSMMRMESFELTPGNPIFRDVCPGSVTSFAQLALYARRRVQVNTAIGSDLNGFITMTGPRFGDRACPDIDPGEARDGAAAGPAVGSPTYQQRGVETIAEIPDLLNDMASLGGGILAPEVANLRSSAENFIRMWERAWTPQGRTLLP